MAGNDENTFAAAAFFGRVDEMILRPPPFFQLFDIMLVVHGAE